ncbi:MAG: hypothetical protein RIF33_20545 [Cyclobacteriaceae bacterium]
MSFLKNKNFVTLILSLLGPLTMMAQADQGGFIIPGDSIKVRLPIQRNVYIPLEGFTLYDGPNGDFSGRILAGSPQNSPGTSAPVPDHLKNMQASITGIARRPEALDLSFFFETYDDCYYIRFDRKESGFVRVLGDATEDWLSITDIERSGFKLVSWIDFYGEIGRMVVPPHNASLPLRASPYADAEILLEIDENHFEVEVIPFEEGQSCEGSFCYVRVTQFKLHPCYGGEYDADNIVKERTGWLQFIDEDGARLVFHNSHGC